jgi:endonuclease-3
MEAKRAAKKPFDIDLAMERVEAAVRPYPKAALFELAEEGYSSLFEQLVACIISIRTLDEVTLPTARRLFAEARTPEAIRALDYEKVESLIHTSSFSERKAAQIQTIAGRVVKEFAGTLPCDRELLLSFSGVGPKCANLALGIACNERFISVDVHVDRVTNRWGYVEASTPEKTMVALEQKLPERYWIDINRLLVPFGKFICTGRLPRCSTCPLLEMCEQRGVQAHR